MAQAVVSSFFNLQDPNVSEQDPYVVAAAAAAGFTQ